MNLDEQDQNMNRPYLTLAKKASDLGLPLHFEDDIRHWDRIILETYAPIKEFIWIVYECGSHIFGSWDNAEKTIDLFYKCFVKDNSFDNLSHCFHYNKGKIREITRIDALAIIKEWK